MDRWAAEGYGGEGSSGRASSPARAGARHLQATPWSRCVTPRKLLKFFKPMFTNREILHIISWFLGSLEKSDWPALGSTLVITQQLLWSPCRIGPHPPAPTAPRPPPPQAPESAGFVVRCAHSRATCLRGHVAI